MMHHQSPRVRAAWRSLFTAKPQTFDTDCADTRRFLPRYIGVPLRKSVSKMGLNISKSPRVRVARLFLFRSYPTVRRTRTGCVPPASARVHAQTPACATTWVDNLHTGTRPDQDDRSSGTSRGAAVADRTPHDLPRFAPRRR